MPQAANTSADLTNRLERRVERERRARLHAEDLLEAKSRELYDANQSLSCFAAELEQRVEDRTRELAAAREQAIRLAERDQLTGLPNRMCFTRALEAEITKSRRDATRFALLLIDLDNFKEINDTLGHEAGDTFLQHAATRIAATLSPTGFVARLGGDEFAALVPTRPASPTLGPDGDVQALADRLISVVRMPVAYLEQMLEASCSIGIAVFPDVAAEAGELQRHADLALYKAKSAGRARHLTFDAPMKTEFEDRHLLGAELKQAIVEGAVEPWFQPIVLSATGKILGLEALARWRHPTRGTLPPKVFLRLAEERGLMHDLFTSMLRATCTSARPWLAAGTIEYVSINVSPSQFRSGSLPSMILRLLDDLSFPPDALTIEITEDLLLFDLDRARAQLDVLTKGGVRIALDDFGIGYSNVVYLRQLPIHIIKLDRALTADVCNDQKARSVLSAIVEIARALELEIIAEGIENQAQALWLSHLGCRYLQGYYFGKPMSETAFAELSGQPSLSLERVA